MQSSTSSQLVAIPYGSAIGMHSFQRERIVRMPLADLVADLRTEIELADLWVLNEIDPQMLLARGGFAIRPARQLLFFHPRYVARLLAADPAALVEAPLKFVLASLPDGTVALRWNDPAMAFGRYGDPRLIELGADLAASCDRIVGAVLGGVR